MSLGRLTGAWRLTAFEFTDAGGSVFRPLGERPAGALVVSHDGHVVFSFCASDRARFAFDDVFAGAGDELAAAAALYVSFGGPGEIDDHAIAVRVDYSLFPNWVGTIQRRLYELDGDRLILTTDGPRMFAGVERRARAVLERY
jgi:Lipocalin-like domain